ncbi:7600_t:CDS:2 [Dentiscutata heterogama]|uniref:7600_t:CDS:1 n=1 Tax=Dentiscutata heterogama TaxID=1316150 RepID=A0ACA9LZT3_9GLOM|nr:7600_t:CDS:2 [Dentiscutata heterogama]
MAHIILKIANLIAFFFLLGVNVYSGLAPVKDAPLAHVTYISPAYFTFYVWFLIHLLLTGFVIYQFFTSEEEIIRAIHWHFVGVALLNTLWLALWDDDMLFLAWIVVLILACQVTYIYREVHFGFAYDNFFSWKYFFIHLPFTLYHAWIVVVVVLTTFAALTPEKTYQEVTTDGTTTEVPDSPSIIVQLVVIIGLLFLESTSVAYIEAKKDYAGGAVIAWTLYGVWCEQEDAVIHWSALILAIIATIYLFKPLVVEIVSGGKKERQSDV